VRIRVYYGYGYTVYVFCNDPETLVDVELEKTKEHIQKYYVKYDLSEDDLERYAKILKLDRPLNLRADKWHKVLNRSEQIITNML